MYYRLSFITQLSEVYYTEDSANEDSANVCNFAGFILKFSTCRIAFSYIEKL